MMTVFRPFSYACFALLMAAPARAGFDPIAQDAVPLRIEIETALDFSRVALSGDGGGVVALDVQSGARRTTGTLMDMGGLAFRGAARLTGRPMAAVRVDLPNRIILRTTTGATAEIIAIKSTLTSAPMLGPDGQLNFQFAGDLIVKGRVSGNFRGNIAISAEYE
jgi:Domain of unknown function (DUF4402)